MANTTADKLAKLNSTKAALKSAINGSGSTVGDVFSAYPAAITSGKTAIAQAITNKGVTTAANATFQQMATNIGQIETGGLQASQVNEYDFMETTSRLKVGIIYVENFGIIPILARQELTYSLICANGQEVIVTDAGGVISIEYSEDFYDVISIDYNSGIFECGNAVFAPENIKLFINKVN